MKAKRLGYADFDFKDWEFDMDCSVFQKFIENTFAEAVKWVDEHSKGVAYLPYQWAFANSDGYRKGVITNPLDIYFGIDTEWQDNSINMFNVSLEDMVDDYIEDHVNVDGFIENDPEDEYEIVKPTKQLIAELRRLADKLENRLEK